MMRSLFTRSQTDPRPALPPTVLSGPRMARHSSGWSAMLKHLKAEPGGLRLLDVGPTSPTNINFLTSLGHGVYMADVVKESHNSHWLAEPLDAPESGRRVNVESFLNHNFNFAGREFDVVLLWTTLDYLPEDVAEGVIQRLYEAVRPGGRVLALFHTKLNGADTSFCRYHLTDSDSIEVQESAKVPLQRVYTNRSIEKIFSSYSNLKFFLAKDNVYEVIITR